MNKMNVLQYIDTTDEELRKLGTRHLVAIVKFTRGPYFTCGCYSHCGDEYLPQDERETNEKVYALRGQVKDILATRPHLLSSHEARHRHVRKGPEKKAMRY